MKQNLAVIIGFFSLASCGDYDPALKNETFEAHRAEHGRASDADTTNRVQQEGIEVDSDTAQECSAAEAAVVACSDDLLNGGSDANICIGPWRYVTYDCYNEQQDSVVCGWSGRYEQKNATSGHCVSSAFGTIGFLNDAPVYASGDSLEHCGVKVCGHLLGLPAANFCRHEDFGYAGFFHQNPGDTTRYEYPESSLSSKSNPLASHMLLSTGHFGATASLRYSAAAPTSHYSAAAYRICLEQAKVNARANLPEGSYGVCQDEQVRRIGSSMSVITYAQKYYVPIYNERQDASRCGTSTCAETWVDDFHRPIARTCRHEAFGRAASNVCGSVETVHYDKCGQSQHTLPPDDFWAWGGQMGSAVCTTDNIDDGARASDRFERLRLAFERLEHGEYSSEEHVALQQQLASRLKLVFELHGLHLRDEQRDYVMHLYQEYDDGHLCGAPAHLRMTQCERLALPHVNKNLAAMFVQQCANAYAQYP